MQNQVHVKHEELKNTKNKIIKLKEKMKKQMMVLPQNQKRMQKLIKKTSRNKKFNSSVKLIMFLYNLNSNCTNLTNALFAKRNASFSFRKNIRNAEF